MNELYDTINKNLTTARKAKDKFKVTLLSTLKGELGRISDGKPETLIEDRVIKRIRNMVEGVEEILQHNFGDSSEMIKERDILNSYLPKMLSEFDIICLVEEAIVESGAEGLKDMGKVMGALKKHAAVMDMKIASEHVKRFLGEN